MIIGMVLAEDKETIVPIIEGIIARIYDTVSGEFSDSKNPSLGLTEGRRGATVSWMVKNEARVLCAPPGTLCELSYSKAQEERIQFYRINPGTKFYAFVEQLQTGKLDLDYNLPDGEIEPSN